MTDLPDAPAVVLGTLTELRTIPEDHWTEGTTADLGRSLQRLRALIDMCEDAAYVVEDALAARMEDDTMTIVGVGLARRVEERRSSWRSPEAGQQMREDLAARVAVSVATDNATGEIDTMKRNVAAATMRLAYESIPAFSSLKQAGRRSLGLNIGDYRTYETVYRVILEEAL